MEKYDELLKTAKDFVTEILRGADSSSVVINRCTVFVFGANEVRRQLPAANLFKSDLQSLIAASDSDDFEGTIGRFVANAAYILELETQIQNLQERIKRDAQKRETSMLAETATDQEVTGTSSENDPVRLIITVVDHKGRNALTPFSDVVPLFAARNLVDSMENWGDMKMTIKQAETFFIKSNAFRR